MIYVSSTEKSGPEKVKRNKESTRSTSTCLQYAVVEGIGEQLRLTDAQNEERPGKLYCLLCARWLQAKTYLLKDHVLGKNIKQPDGTTYVRQPGGHAAKVLKAPVMPTTPAEAGPVVQNPPTVVVNVTTPDKPREPECPPPKKKTGARHESFSFRVRAVKGDTTATISA